MIHLKYQALAEACSSMRVLVVLSSAFSLKALALAKVYRLKIQDGYQNNTGFSRGTMHAIFSDSIFGMTMYVSLCGYMKWNNLNWRKKGVSLWFPTNGGIRFVCYSAQPFLLSEGSLSFSNVMITLTSTLWSTCIVELTSGLFNSLHAGNILCFCHFLILFNFFENSFRNTICV